MWVHVRARVQVRVWVRMDFENVVRVRVFGPDAGVLTIFEVHII